MRRILSVGAALLAGSQAFAESWVCDFPKASDDDWLRKQVTIEVNGSEAMVSDSLIQQVNGGPVKASRVTNDDTHLKVSWQLYEVTLEYGSAAKLNYAVVYRKNSDRASFSLSAPTLRDVRGGRYVSGKGGTEGKCRQR